MAHDWRIIGVDQSGDPLLCVLGEDKTACCIAVVEGWPYAELRLICRAWYEFWFCGQWQRDDDIPLEHKRRHYSTKLTIRRLREMRRQKEIAEGTLTGRARCGRKAGAA